jgi:hypothetical protein
MSGSGGGSQGRPPEGRRTEDPMISGPRADGLVGAALVVGPGRRWRGIAEPMRR